MLINTEYKHPQLYIIAPDEVQDYWPFFGEYLLIAERKGGHLTDEQIVWKLLSGEYIFFAIHRGGEPVGAFTVELLKDVAVIRQLGGSMDTMMEVYPEFEDWLKAFRVTKIRMTGRRGWARKLPQWGFKERYVTMEKDIE